MLTVSDSFTERLLKTVVMNRGGCCSRCGLVVQTDCSGRRDSAYPIAGRTVCGICRREMRVVRKLVTRLKRRIQGHATYGPWVPKNLATRPKSPATPPARNADAMPVPSHVTKRQVGVKDALMIIGPRCANCGIGLHQKRTGNIETFARLIRGPRKLACRKCSGIIAARFHAERLAAAKSGDGLRRETENAAMPEQCSDGCEMVSV